MTKNNIKSGQLVKEQHLNTLLRHLILDDCTTRIGLAKKTGLTKMTVTNLVNELIQNKLICETGTQESKDSLPGRRPIYLVVHPEAPHIIDVTIGRDFLSVSRVDMKLNIIIQQKIKLSGENLQSLLHKIESELEYIIRYKPNDILGIGVVTPGPVDAENGLIINPPNFSGSIISTYAATSKINSRSPPISRKTATPARWRSRCTAREKISAISSIFSPRRAWASGSSPTTAS